MACVEIGLTGAGAASRAGHQCIKSGSADLSDHSQLIRGNSPGPTGVRLFPIRLQLDVTRARAHHDSVLLRYPPPEVP